MTTAAEKILRAAYNQTNFDEWWATEKSDEFVLVGNYGNDTVAVRFKAWAVPVPNEPPSAVLDEGLPHPFGFA